MSGGRPASVYRLQALLELRRRTRDERRSELARAVAAETAAAGEHAAAERDYNAQLEALRTQRAAGKKGGLAQDFIVEQRFSGTLTRKLEESREELRRLTEALERQQQAVARATAALRAAEAAVKAVQTHRDLWQRARARDSARRAEEELDDQAGSRSGAGDIDDGTPSR